MNKIGRSVFLYGWFIVLVSLLLLCLMWSVYLIPIEKIRANVSKSVDQVPTLLFADIHSYRIHKDNFTDSLMLNETSFWGREPLYDALLNPRVEPRGRLNQLGNLKSSVITSGLENIPIIDYGRYWHGYLLFLKPLTVFCDLQTIRIINLFVHVILLLSVLILLYRRLDFRYSFAYFCAFLFLNPEITWQCLQYATSVNMMLLASLWILLARNPSDRYIFFIVGAITSVFDFLTFPLVTLGFPLIIYICLYDRSFKNNVACVIKNSLLWGLGYVGMFLGKWILATVLTHQNVLLDGWENFLYRVGETEERAAFGQAVQRNILEIYHVETLYFFVIFLFGLIFSYFIKPYRFLLSAKSLIVLGIGLMPFVWYAFLTNHSAVHHFMTYRILAITICALFTSVVCCIKPKSV